MLWEWTEGPPSCSQNEATERSNAQILAFLLAEIDLDAAPRPADERLVEALAPLRAKLDMVIGMLARLSYRDTELPPRCDIELGEERLAWHDRQPRPIGARLRSKMYFHPTFCEPVTVFAEVVGSIEDGGEHRVEAVFHMPPRISADLRRLALLVQRRQQARHAVGIAKRGE